MIVLSLFDGMSCGQIALRDMGITPEVYYASEVDKFAIAQTQLNFPDTIQLGDVRQLDMDQLATLGGGKIDLLIGGSPCQSFSFAGKGVGMTTKGKEKVLSLDRYLELKSQGFEFEGQSFLFWEYMRILTELRKRNPDIKFMLENVKMKKEWEDVITQAIGVSPVLLDSALVSAQSRKRLYWTNIAKINLPEDRNIRIRDVLGNNVAEKHYLKPGVMEAHWRKKAITLPPSDGNEERFLFPYDDYNSKFPKDLSKAGTVRQTFASLAIRNGFKLVEASPENIRVRRFTPSECARLQTIPDWYIWGKEISDTQKYKMLGNGWTVEIIKHIFSYLPH